MEALLGFFSFFTNNLHHSMNRKATLTAFLVSSWFLAYGQNYLMNATTTSVTDCNGFFMDSGGGTGEYGPNESFTTTLCPDGSTGTHTQLVFSGTQIAAGDELCFFDGAGVLAPSLGCASDFGGAAAFIIQATAANPSGCLTLTFYSGGADQAAGWSAGINCIPACQIIEAVLDSTAPAVIPADTGWIDICPGDRVFFWGKGNYPQNGAVYNHSDFTSNFQWDFGDGTLTYGPNVSHAFDEPGGYVVQLSITDQLGCRSTSFISQRIRVSPRPHFVLGDYPAQICAGDTVNLNAMVNNLDSLHTVSVASAEDGFQTQGVRSDSLPLPDGNGSSYETTIGFTDFSPGQILNNINDLLGIFVNMEHSWMRDLQIRLTCPNGQTAILHDHPGQTGGEVYLGIPYEADEGFPTPVPGVGYDYGWAPNPGFDYTWIEYANAFLPTTLPSGTYNSYQPLNNFLGCPLNGDWTIEVTDLWAIDNGYIFSWSIDFDPDLYPNIETFSPTLDSWSWNNHPSIFYLTSDSISGSPVNAGEVAYTFNVIDDFGCSWDTTVDIQVLPFTHPDCYSCAAILMPVSDTTVCFEEPVLMDAGGTGIANAAVTFESYDDYAIGAGNHPPANPYNSVIQVNSVNPGTVTDVFTNIASICLDLETDFDADIQLVLEAPNGQSLVLSANNGGGGDNYTQTCFTPSATVPIAAGSPPFTGNFLPEGDWTALNGVPINGNWSLRISDSFGLNSYGNLNWWAITFNSTNDITYNWSPAAELSCNDCPNPTATPSSDMTYTVSASDSYGCTSADTVELGVLFNFPAPNVTCLQQPGGEVLVTWNDVTPGGTSYLINVNNAGWQASNNGNLSHIVSGLVNGDAVDIQVEVDAGGAACQVGVGASFCTYQLCPITASIITPGPYAVSCVGNCDESLEIEVLNSLGLLSFGITNQTTGDTSSQASGILSNFCPGDYEVIVTDDVGCADTVNFMVAEPTAMTITAQQDSPVSCNGGMDGCASALATGGVGVITYVWGNPNMSLGASICILPAGPMTVTATDENGCQVTAALDISEPAAIALDLAQTNVSCFGGANGAAMVTPSGGVGNFSYQWSGGDTPTQPTTGGLTAGNYTVLVEDGNGCQATGNVTIGQPATAVQVSVIQTFTSCFGEDMGEATASATGGAGNYTFQWMPSNQTTQTATGLMPANYTVLAADANGCTASANIDIQQWDAFDITIIANPPACNGTADGEMAVNVVTGGNGIYSFEWSTGSTAALITGLTGGITYTVTVTDSQGCTGEESRFLNDPAAIAVQTSATDAFCNGAADGMATVDAVLNAQGSVLYHWDAAALNQTTAVADSLGAGIYSVVVTDTAGCTGTGTATISEPPPMLTNFTTIDNECFGYSNGAIDAGVSGGAGGYVFLWSNGAATSKLTGLKAGVYLVTITDANGCEKIDSASVAEPKALDATITPSDVSCFGAKDGSITISPQGGTPPFTYSLDGANFYGASTLIALTAGDYPVYIKDGEGCIFTSQATVNEPLEMSVQILASGNDVEEVMVDFGNTVPLNAVVTNGIGTIQYTWDAAYCGTLSCDTLSDCNGTLFCSSVISTPDYTNDYWVLAVDENGCEAEDHLKIHVKKERRVLVPTGFTPGGDGVNDLLTVHGKSGTMIRVFQVFDRWGELLYEQFDIPINDLTMGWDGTFKTRDMSAGVYVWYLEAQYDDGMVESFKGETTLIR
jgi:gliding motility-associated-like protein